MSDLEGPPPGFFRLHIQDHAESEAPPPPRILDIPVENITMIPVTEARDEPIRLIPPEN